MAANGQVASSSWVVPPREIEARLDAEFYLPSHLAVVERLLDTGCALRLRDIECDGAYGILPGSDEYGTGSLPLIRGGDLTGQALTDVPKDAPLVPDGYYRHSRGRMMPGQVMLLIKGATIDSPESVGVVPETWTVRSVINGSIYKFGVRDPHDPYYVCTFFGTRFGLLQKTRAIANTGISYNDQDAIRDFIVVLPDPSVQRAIGNKLRKAGRHQARASELLDSIRSDIERLAGDAPPRRSEPTWVAPALLNHRLDCHRYEAHFVEAERRLRARSGAVRTLEHLRDADAPINNSLRDVTHAVQASGRPIIRGTNISPPWINTTDILRIDPKVEERSKRSRVRVGDLVICVAGSLGVVGIVPETLDGANINSSCARLRVGQSVDAHYVAAFLSSEMGQTLLLRESVGSVQRHLNLEDIPDASILVPSRYEQEEVGGKLREAQRNREQALTLSTDARADVEALVEGTLDTEALLANNEGIERWLNDSDRVPSTALAQRKAHAK